MSIKLISTMTLTALLAFNVSANDSVKAYELVRQEYKCYQLAITAEINENISKKHLNKGKQYFSDYWEIIKTYETDLTSKEENSGYHFGWETGYALATIYANSRMSETDEKTWAKEAYLSLCEIPE